MKTVRSHRISVAVVSYIAMIAFAVVSATPAQAAASAPAPWMHQSELSVGGSGRLGSAVAISANRRTIAASAPEMTVNGQDGAGAVEVYRLGTGGWGSPTQLDLGASARAYDYFSGSLALSADGNTLIATGGRRTADGKAYTGAAEIYRFSGGRWSAATQIDLGSGDIPNEGFESVSLSADGSTALIGYPFRSLKGKTHAGMAQVYRFVAGSWKLQTQLSLGAKARKNDEFGYSVALSADGRTALTGVLQRSKTVQYSGKAEVFRLAGGKWGRPTQLSLGSAAGPHDAFGWSVDLSSNGSVALIGAPDRDSGQPNAGAGEVFRFQAGKWRSPTQLGWGRSLDSLGQSVALSADGSTALLGSPGRKVYDQKGAGAGMVFRFARGRWSSPVRLNLGADANPTDLLGYSVGLTGNGKTAVLGAPLRAVSGVDYSGAAEVFGTPY